VPTTLIGLLLFVALLAPGFVYVLRREAERPARPVSAFRETALVVLVSVVCNVAVLLILGVLRGLASQHTPDVGALVRQPASYARGHYRLLFGWGVGLLMLASVLAVVLAQPAVTAKLSRAVRGVRGLRWLLPAPTGALQPMSAWWRLFAGDLVQPSTRIYLGCELDDGSYIAGWLRSYNHDAPESGDRDLVLSAPVTERPPRADTAEELADVQYTVISARRLTALHVTLVKLPAEPEASARPISAERSGSTSAVG